MMPDWPLVGRAHAQRRAGILAMLVMVAGACSVAVPARAASCTVNAIGVMFGTYDTLSSQGATSAGSVTVTCDVADSYSIALSSGRGTMLARQLQGGAYTLYYNLYTDALHSIIWGDGTGGTALVSGSGTSATYTAYGLLPARQNVPVGTYSDSVTVTLLF
jgi:spore coat protein U-like protein